MTSVSPLSLGKKIIELLDARDGEAIDLSKLRDGSVLLKRVES